MSDTPSTVAYGRRDFITIALALTAATIGASLISPLFPLYQNAWQLPTSGITAIFVYYMVGAIVAFLFLGRLVGYMGPARVLKIALVVMLLGLSLCAVAQSEWVLGIGRFISGVASGMASTSATIALIKYAPQAWSKRAPVVATTTTMAGFGMGPIVCGALAQWLPWPLRLPYIVVFIAVLACLIALMRIRLPVRETLTGQLSFMPGFALPERARLTRFLLASMGVFCASALFSLLASLAPSMLDEMLPWHGPVISGLSIGVILMISASIQIPASRLALHSSARLGFALMGLGLAMLGVSLYSHSFAIFLAAVITIGLGHGISFMAGLTVVAHSSTEAERGRMIASFYTIGYLGTILPTLAVGWAADHLGVLTASLAYCVLGVLLIGGLLVMAFREFRKV